METVAYRCEQTRRNVVVWIFREDISGIGDEEKSWVEVGRQCVEHLRCAAWPDCPLEG